MIYQIGQMAKISPAFLQRLSNTACCIAQMYKVELKGQVIGGSIALVIHSVDRNE